MIGIAETKEKMLSEGKHWRIPFFDFVDDFRYHKNPDALSAPFELGDDKIDALLASTAESLCDELKIEPPDWLDAVPACKEPYFVSGVENLKAIAIVESPVRFRIRKIFVMQNFLSRV